MNRYLFVLLLFIAQAFAENGITNIKIKAIQVANKTTVKFMLNVKIYNQERAKLLDTTPYYISNITAIVENKTVYNAFFSPYLSTNPLFEFNYLETGTSDRLELLITDSNDKTVKKSTLIKNSSKLPSKMNLHGFMNDLVNPTLDVWNATDTKEAIKKLYGSQEVVDGGFKISSKGNNAFILDDGICFDNGGRIDLTIQSDLNLSSLAVFQDSNPHSTIAIFQNYKTSITDYRLTFTMKKTSTITVIGKNKDGKLYKNEQIVYIVPGTHHNCYGEYTGP